MWVTHLLIDLSVTRQCDLPWKNNWRSVITPWTLSFIKTFVPVGAQSGKTCWFLDVFWSSESHASILSYLVVFYCTDFIDHSMNELTELHQYLCWMVCSSLFLLHPRSVSWACCCDCRCQQEIRYSFKQSWPSNCCATSYCIEEAKGNNGGKEPGNINVYFIHSFSQSVSQYSFGINFGTCGRLLSG